MRFAQHIKYLSILACFVLGGKVVQGQESLNTAFKMLQRGSLDSAKAVIDKAAVDTVTGKQAQTWYLRGFIYKEIYKSRESDNVKSPARVEAVNSMKKSLELDTSKANRDANIPTLKYFASKYYNDAVTTMDTSQYKMAIESYEKYKGLMTIVDPTMSFIQPDITFYLALASQYRKIFEADRIKNAPYLELAKATYLKVLGMDPNNISANYNMGTLYYNQAVNLINQADYDIDIVTLSDIQDNSIALFKQSLPFMEKAYTLDPNNVSTLEGLSGIYFSLNEFEKHNQYREKLEEIKNKNK